MKVIDIAKKDIIAVNRSLTLRGLFNKFKDFHTHPFIPVVDKKNILIGVVYPENLLDLLRPLQVKLFRNVPFLDVDEDIFDLDPVPLMGELIIVDDVMDTNFVVIKETDSLEIAYKAIRLHKMERLPVVNELGELSGILGIFDIIRKMFAEKGIE